MIGRECSSEKWAQIIKEFGYDFKVENKELEQGNELRNNKLDMEMSKEISSKMMNLRVINGGSLILRSSMIQI